MPASSVSKSFEKSPQSLILYILTDNSSLEVNWPWALLWNNFVTLELHWRWELLPTIGIILFFGSRRLDVTSSFNWQLNWRWELTWSSTEVEDSDLTSTFELRNWHQLKLKLTNLTLTSTDVEDYLLVLTLNEADNWKILSYAINFIWQTCCYCININWHRDIPILILLYQPQLM